MSSSLGIRRISPAVALFSIALVAGLFGCSDDDDTHRPAGTPAGRLLDHGECKSHGTFSRADSIAAGEDCFAYDYDGEGVLLVTHVNAAFNCCPDTITGAVTVRGDTIRIVEGEVLEDGGCRCLCLYDLRYRITGLPPGVYHVEFEELYVLATDAPLGSRVDLTAAVADTVCVARDHYPWQVP
jgi:hypothetical protein